MTGDVSRKLCEPKFEWAKDFKLLVDKNQVEFQDHLKNLHALFAGIDAKTKDSGQIRTTWPYLVLPLAVPPSASP